MKGYHDIAGDGGSRVLEQVTEQRARITDGLAGVRHLVAVGSGKGGVGKSTLTLHLAGALRARGLRIAILDADFNGPSQARMAGVQGALFVPGRHKVALPRTSDGIGVFSMGSVIPESEALEFESAAHGESHTWRATREFALLGEILGAFEWGALDLLMFDLPPGAERTVQYADFLGPRDLVRARDDSLRGGTGRRRALGGRPVEGTQPPPRLRREHERLLLPRLRRDQAALRLARAERERPAWRSPASAPSRSIPSWPGTAIEGSRSPHCPSTPLAGPWSRSRSGCWTASTSTGAFPMKFLCVPCDSPMKLQTVGPPERGSLSVVYACPECGYEMAMLTNAYETQIVQSLGVRIGPRPTRGAGTSARPAAGARSPACCRPRRAGRRRCAAGDDRPVAVRWTAGRRGAAREHPRVRPPDGADRHRAFRARARGARGGRDDPRRGPRLLRHVTGRMHADARSPGPTSSPGTSPTAATSPASTAISTPAARRRSARESFADRSELDTEGCFRVIDEIAAFAPECVTILTGGEPLLRRDILEIVRRAAERGLWVVVGTNGVRITENLARRLADAGARGLSLSLDALDPDRHDRFRKVRGAWRNTVEGAEILGRTGLPFIVQTTAGAHNLGELEAIAAFAHDRLAAKVWNLYFLVPTGRGQFVSDITPAQYDEVLASLHRIQRTYDRRMLVNAKCAPHYIKTACWSRSGEAARSRTYSDGAGGCPAGTHYMGIRPNGDVTPCPYLPVFAGSLRSSSLADLWTSSELFTAIRRRTALGGRCGACEMNGHCGGCRARAYGMSGDLMAEDPLCTHTPGHVRRVAPARQRGRAATAGRRRGTVTHGVRPGIAADHRLGRRGRRAHEEDPGVRPGDGRQGRRGVLPQERPRPRDRRGARAHPRADADAEDLRAGVTTSLARFELEVQNEENDPPADADCRSGLGVFRPSHAATLRRSGRPGAGNRRAPGAPQSQAAPPAPASPPAPTYRDVTVPANTTLTVKLETPVASDTSEVEDKVRGTLARPIVIGGETIVPAGADLGGNGHRVEPVGTREGPRAGRLRLRPPHRGRREPPDRGHARRTRG